jgi:hypothetical protein
MAGTGGTVGTVGTVCTVLGLGVGRDCRGAGGFIYSENFAGIGGGGVWDPFCTCFETFSQQVGARWGSRQFQVPAGVGTHEFPRSGEAGGVQEEGRI